MKIPVIRAFERVPSLTLKDRKSAGYKHGRAIYLLIMSVKTAVAMCNRREIRIDIFVSCIWTNCDSESVSVLIFNEMPVSALQILTPF